MNDKLISKSFNSMMIMMIFAGVVAMCGSVIDGVIIGNCLSADSMTAFGYASPVFIFLAAIGGVLSNGEKRSVQSLPERDFMRKHVRIFPVYSCLLLFWVLESRSSVWRLQNRLLFFLELLVPIFL